MRSTMKTLAVAALGAAAATGAEAASFQPPMDTFNDAFYACTPSGAFLVSYDGPKPTAATLTTSNNNRSYRLKRTPVDAGAEFSGGGATFWTDGAKVRVIGTQATLQGCRLKPH